MAFKMRHRFAPYVLFVVLIPVAQGANYMEEFSVTTEATYEILLDKWSGIESKLKSGMESVISRILPTLIRTSSEVEISEKCTNGILRIVQGLKEFKETSLLMADATGKIPCGIFSGTAMEFGDFDQCVNIMEHDENTEELIMQGKYCLVDFRSPIPKRKRFFSFHRPMPPTDNYTTKNYVMKELKQVTHFMYFMAYRFGVCVPSTCEKADVLNLAQYFADQIGFNVDVPHCQIKEQTEFDTAETLIIVIIGIFVVLCLIGTVTDLVRHFVELGTIKGFSSEQSLAERFFTCFSVQGNVRRLFAVNKTQDKSLRCINGIRFISITWVIVGHTYLFTSLQVLRHAKNGIIYISSISFQMIINGLLSVDTFFFLSGFLISFLSIKIVDSKQGKGFNIPLVLARRIWRLLPSTSMIIAITILVPTISSGPTWHEATDILRTNCRKKWWTDVLFINNFVHPVNMCLPHTWYIAADTQLFLIAMLYIYIFLKHTTIGILFNIVLILTSIISTSLVNYWKDFPPILLVSHPHPTDLLDFWYYVHSKPHVHLGIYSIGLALGTYLARCKEIKIRPIKQFFFWCVAITCNMSIIFATYEWNRGNDPSVMMSTIYSGMHRVGWGIGIAWMTLACVKGYGGVINSILSWKGFIPLSRLTFLAYLWHYIIIFVYLGSTKGGIDGNHLVMVWMYLGNLVISFCLASLSWVLYDAPFAQLEKLLLEQLKKKSKDYALNTTDSTTTPNKLRENQNTKNCHSNSTV